MAQMGMGDEFLISPFLAFEAAFAHLSLADLAQQLNAWNVSIDNTVSCALSVYDSLSDFGIGLSP